MVLDLIRLREALVLSGAMKILAFVVAVFGVLDLIWKRKPGGQSSSA
jgi:hypothetical protein